MQRYIYNIIALVAACATTLMVGCGGISDERAHTLKVYNWGDYIDENVLTMFEDETGAKIEYILYDSNDTMYERITKSNESFDICIPSDYMIERLIKEYVELLNGEGAASDQF